MRGIVQKFAGGGLACGFMVAGLLYPAAVGAQATQTYRACFVPDVGALYLIALEGLPTACLSTGHNEISWTDGPSGGSPSVHSTLGGLDQDDHPQYMLLDGFRPAIDGFAIWRGQGSGTPPPAGITVPRLMWNAKRGAFRVGNGPVDDWDNQNLGRWSFASGTRPQATGDNSVALGEVAIASGPGAIALGRSGRASGLNSLAFGGEASADNAIALGTNADSRGANSFAVGTAIAQGDFSIAMGKSATAGGTNFGVAIGEDAATFGGIAIGTSVQANSNAVAIGRDILSAGGGVAIGRSLNAESGGVALGSDADASSGSFVFGDGSGSGSEILTPLPNSFAVRAQSFWFGRGSVYEFNKGLLNTSTGAFLSNGGTWVDASSREWKHEFEPVDRTDVLDRVRTLSIKEWSYKKESTDVRHIGPVAEDFYTQFGLGSSEQHIASLDGVGVSLLAIQALADQLERLERENAELTARVARLERRQR